MAYSLIYIGSFVIAVLLFSLGMFVYLSNRKVLSHKLFFLLALSSVLWILSIVAIFNLDQYLYVLIAARMAFVFTTCIGFSMYAFTYYFPIKNTNYKAPFKTLIVISSVFIVLSLTSFIIDDMLIEGDVRQNVSGPGFYIFILYFVIYIFSSLFNIISKRSILNQLQKAQTNLVLTGFIISSIFGVITNLIIPIVTASDVSTRFGPLMVSIFVVLSSYAILKYKLFNIKVIAVETLSFIIFLIFFIRLLLSSGSEMILNAILLVFVAFFSVFLVRSVMKDVQDRERIEQLGKDLVVANEQLRRLDKQKSDFVSIASHQLRTPLTAIKGYASLVLEDSFGQISNKVREAMTKIFESSQRMVMVVENFLTVSRIEQGKMYYKFETLDLQRVTKGMVGDMRPVAEGYGLEIRFQENIEQQYFVRADYIKIKQVVHNLLDDSIG
ncbi:MAG: hypothetical protein KAS07_01540, partial [Candidatus Pacebacteria bacterium]|nr:hypothetical protein [Candidatus Paceibacterota bacterium]